MTLRVGVLFGGLLLLLLVASSRYLGRLMWSVTKWGLQRFGGIHVHDYTRLFVLAVSKQMDIAEQETKSE